MGVALEERHQNFHQPVPVAMPEVLGVRVQDNQAVEMAHQQQVEIVVGLGTDVAVGVVLEELVDTVDTVVLEEEEELEHLHLQVVQGVVGVVVLGRMHVGSVETKPFMLTLMVHMAALVLTTMAMLVEAVRQEKAVLKDLEDLLGVVVAVVM